GWRRLSDDGRSTLIRVTFADQGNVDKPFVAWCELGRLPASELFPSFLWFFLKMLLFSVGAIVFWKRPNDDAAAQFFLFCVVTLCAYMGGYHWAHFTTQPAILVVFIVCAVLLPAVNLHFYMLFPRRKAWLDNHPRQALLAIY